MNKVITINLNGNAYQVEEGGYDALRSYLASAERTLEGNPDKSEILNDIEQSIADKCRALLGPHKTVVTAGEAARIVEEMGPVRDGSGEAEAAKPEPEAGGNPPPVRRRLYLIREGSMIGGVCNGLAAYFDFDPTIVRLVVVLLAFLTLGAVLAGYIILLLVVPYAETPEQRAAAHGAPFTAEEFVKRAREGYYRGMDAFGDRQARREWRRRFKREMREWRRNFREEMRARHWGAPWHYPPPARGLIASLLIGVILVCRWAIGLVFVFALLSFLLSGTIFGFFLFAGWPFWLGLIVLIVAYGIVVAPFKILQHAVEGRGAWHDSPFDGVVGLLALLFAVWLACHLFPALHHLLRDLVIDLRSTGEALRSWWNSRSV